MTVGHGNAYALRGNERGDGVYDLAVLDLSPDLKGFKLALFFLAAYVGNYVVHHFGPFSECLACAGDSLIRGNDDLCGFELHKGRDHRNVRLNGAVRFYDNKSVLGSETLLLSFDDFKVIVVYLRNYHRDVFFSSVCGVV